MKAGRKNGFTVAGSDWSSDSGSESECDWSTGSSILSSDLESVLAEDLNLYDSECVFQLPIKSHGLK